jgi:hypothetical protein
MLGNHLIGYFLDSAAKQDLEPWSEDFSLWRDARCACCDGHEDWGGVANLHVDFAQWSVDRREVPCTRITFEALLRDSGYLVADGLVQGLILIAELRAILPGASIGKGQGRSYMPNRTQFTGRQKFSV